MPCGSGCAGCAHEQSCPGSPMSPAGGNVPVGEPSNDNTRVKKIIGVVSGKGGVGKSLVTSLLASAFNKNGFKTAIMDADITGPSIPHIFNVHGWAPMSDDQLYPAETKSGIKIMSINLLTKEETDPVVWRGPIVSSIVKQFWTDVSWGDVDYMFIDMPPGTGDVSLTVFESVPVDGIVMVTSPQDLVSLIVTKTVKMARMMNIPILGIIENFSFFKCMDCGKEYYLFGSSRLDRIAGENELRVLAKIPLDPGLAAACDRGNIEEYNENPLSEMIDTLLALLNSSI